MAYLHIQKWLKYAPYIVIIFLSTVHIFCCIWSQIFICISAWGPLKIVLWPMVWPDKSALQLSCYVFLEIIYHYHWKAPWHFCHFTGFFYLVGESYLYRCFYLVGILRGIYDIEQRMLWHANLYKLLHALSHTNKLPWHRIL